MTFNCRLPVGYVLLAAFLTLPSLSLANPA